VNKNIFKDNKLLTRFISKLRTLPDTPALIRFIAGEEDYLLLCSRIVNNSTDDLQDLKLLKDICRKQEFDFHLLKEKLTPVARAFGLAESESDYYELLEVSRNADQGAIKKAFRRKVVKVHPDTGDLTSAAGQEFINLKAAYQILGDPVSRQQYDETLRDVSLWKEKADHIRRFRGCASRNFQKINQSLSARTKIYYQLGGLFLLLVIAVFLFDFLYRQNAILDADYNAKPKQAQEQKPAKAALKENSIGQSGSNRPEATSLPRITDKSRRISNSDGFSRRATQKAETQSPAAGLR
jgi:curved DNA-binding protein CbpA